MAGAIRDLVNQIEFDVDISGLRQMDTLIDRVQRDVNNMGADIMDAERRLREMGEAGRHGTDEVSGGVNDLRDHIRRLEQQLNDMSSQISDTSRQARNDLDDVGNGQNGMNGARGAADSLVDSLGNIAGKSRLGGLALSGMAAVGAGAIGVLVAAVVGLGASIAGVAASTDEMSDRASAYIGATAQETKAMEKAGFDVYKNGFGESMPQIMDDIAMIKSDFRDMNSTELADFAKKGSVIGDLWGPGIEEINSSVGSMTRNFEGLSKSDALDLITTGFQKGGTKAKDDLLDTFNEYSVYFSKMGMSAQDFTGTLVRGLQAGARNTDLVADAVKELGIRSIDGSKGTVAAFEQLGFNAADMGRKFAAGGDDANQAFLALTSALSMVKDKQEQNAIGVALWGTQFEDLREDVILSMNGAGEAVEGFQGATQKASDTLNDNFGSKMKSVWRGITGTIMEEINNSGLGDSMADLGDQLIAKLPAIIEGVKGMVDFITSLFDGSNSNITAGLSTLLDFFTTTWQLIKVVWEQVGPVLIAEISMAFNTIMAVVTTAIQLVTDVIKIGVALIQGDWSGAWNGMVTLVTNLIGNLGTTVQTILDGIYGLFESTFARSIEYLTGIDLTEVGKNIIQGLIDGIGNMKEVAIAKVEEVAASVKGAVTGFFDIHSPSRVMMDVGGNIVQGMAVGMDNDSTAIESAQTVSGNVLDAMPYLNAANNVPTVGTAATASAGGYSKVISGNTIYITVERGSDGSAPSKQDIRDAMEEIFGELDQQEAV